MSEIGKMEIRIGILSEDFFKSLGKVASNIEKFGRSLKKIGMDLTQGVSLPIAAIAGAALRSSTVASDAFSKFGQRVKTSMALVGNSIFHALDIQGILDKVSAALDQAVDWWYSLSEATRQTVARTAAFIAILGPAILVVAKFVAVIGSILVALKLLAVFLASPAGLIIVGIVALAAVIAKASGAFDSLSEWFNSLKGEAEGATESVKKFRKEQEALRKELEKQEEVRRKMMAELRAAPPVIPKIPGSVPMQQKTTGGAPSSLMGQERRTSPIPSGLQADLDAQRRFMGQAADVSERFRAGWNAAARNVDVLANAFRIVGKSAVATGEQVAGVLAPNVKVLADVWKGASSGARKMLEEFHANSRKMAENVGAIWEVQGGGIDLVANRIDYLTSEYARLRAEGIDPANAEMKKMREEIESLSSPWQRFMGLMMTIPPLAQQISELMFNIVQSFAEGVGNAVAQILVYGANVGEVLSNLLKQIAAMIITTLISIGIQRLILALLNVSATATELISSMKAYAATTYAAAFASTSAIPVVGPALAPAIAAAAVGAMLAGSAAAGAAGAGVGAAIGAAAEGGIFTQPGITRIAEKGQPEMVLNESNIKRFFPGMSGRNPIVIHTHVNLDGREVATSTARHLPGILQFHGAI